jgi:Fe-S-cluster containining protein
LAGSRIIRPIVRAFESRFEAEAALHVRAGGHAIIWASPKRGKLVFRKPKGPEEKDLGYWALLDMGRTEWSTVRAGPLRGLAVAPIPRDCVELVRDRVIRDSVHRRSTRTMFLDCEQCAACCRDNRVELDKDDMARFRRAGRPELGLPPYVRKDGRKIILRLLRSKDCRHLQSDKRCGIYPLRPGSCRTFPAGSEGCLFSREEELGIVDGARS